MPFVKVGNENQADIEIHYNDHGTGSPVVLIHGYPLDGNSWERQERELLAAGYRCVSYDRRGFGRSSQPTVGYDYDTFAADLNALLEHLDLRDVVLCGFSMGTGEVTRYLGKYGSGRVRKAALFGVIPPFLLKTEDNPEGVDGQVFEDIKAAIVKDRYAYFKDFLDNFYNVDVLGPERISNQAWQASFNVAVGSSPYASYACVNTWLTDFREDLPKIDVPTLVMHGTEDRILPFDATAARLSDLIPDVRVVPVEGGPHNIGWTHPEEVNPALLDFVAGDSPATSPTAAHAVSV
jgi:non-heme chloroperoxidase